MAVGKLRTVFWTIIITLAATAGLAGAGKWAWGKWRPAKKTLTVEVERVRQGDLVELVQAPGEVMPRKKVAISARVSARIVELPFEEGANVTCGDAAAVPPVPASVLVRLDDKDLKSKLRSAVASREAQQAQLDVEKARIASEEAALEGTVVLFEQAERELQRKQTLLQSGDIGQATFDDLEAKVKGQQAQLVSAKLGLEAARRNLVVLQHRLDAAQAQIDEAEEALGYTIIASPMNGIVTRLNAEVGELVMTGTMNNPGTVIMEVSDLSRMLVVAQIDEADMGRVVVGQQASVRIQAYGDREFRGQVDTIPLTSSKAPTGANVYRVRILLDAGEERLYTGLTANVEIRTREHVQVLLLPSQCILGRKVEELPKDIRDTSPCVDRKKTYATVVYRMIDGKAVVTPVKLGPADLRHTLIETGIETGDTVIVGPYKILDTLQHDAAVQEETKTPTPEPASP